MNIQNHGSFFINIFNFKDFYEVLDDENNKINVENINNFQEFNNQLSLITMNEYNLLFL